MLVRNLAQLDAAWSAACTHDLLRVRRPETLSRRRRPLPHAHGCRSSRPSSVESSTDIPRRRPPRIFKPGEEWILQQVRSSEADGYLVRNYDHLRFFAADRKRGDLFAQRRQPLAADYFLHRFGLERVTASYDLNVAQLEALLQAAPPAWFDITIHQHMPHVSHGALPVLRVSHDRHGLPRLRPALRHAAMWSCATAWARSCRSRPTPAAATRFQHAAQTGAEFVARLLALGARHFRVEFVNERRTRWRARSPHTASFCAARSPARTLAGVEADQPARRHPRPDGEVIPFLV